MLYQRRKELGLDYREAAYPNGLSIGELNKFERGLRDIYHVGFRTLLRLSAAYRIKVQSLCQRLVDLADMEKLG
jgi:hypothetical protein